MNYLEIMHQYHPEYIIDMKDANHNYQDGDNELLNPYHMEGDVWTHTLMVYNEAIKRGYTKEVQLSALFHDIGKPASMKINHEKKRNSFYGHDGYSFYIAADVLSKAHWNLSETEYFTVLSLIAHHSDLFEWKNANVDYSKRFSPNFWELLKRQVQCDIGGRIVSDEIRFNSDLLLQNLDRIENNYTEIKRELKQPTIAVMVGSPRSGKSTYVDKLTNTVVISRDNIVMNKGALPTYNECWNNVNHKEVDKELLQQFNAAVKDRKDIVIDTTNMSRKSRRKWLSHNTVVNEYFTKAVVVIASLDKIMFTDETGKTIPPYVIENMVRSFALPTYNEFNEIELVYGNL